ncbi:UNVERIFIED_CONTAM: Sugar carrier protein C [Sesamum indicum]
MAGGGFGPGPGNRRDYPSNLTPYVIVTCAIASTGGLIFGYDIGISGGVTSMESFLKKFFPAVHRKLQIPDASTNQYCLFDSVTLTLFTSSLYLAAFFSSFAASIVSRKLGRKLSMLLGGVLFCVGALLSGFAEAVWMLIVGRIFLGFGIGFANQIVPRVDVCADIQEIRMFLDIPVLITFMSFLVRPGILVHRKPSVPLYLSEMAPYKYRGALNIGFQLSITIGILAANVLNYGFAKIEGGWGWRLSLGGAVVPALIVTLGSLVLPETPNSLIERGKQDDARANLQRIRGVPNVDQEFNYLVSACEASRRVEHPWRNLLDCKYKSHLAMAIAIPFFQQLAGISAVVFYAPLLFQTFGLGADTALISAVVTGSVNVVATVVSIYCVDKWGRRFLFLEGGIQMLICLIAVAVCMALKFGVDGNPGEIPKWYAVVVVAFICVYVAGFAWSWGPLGWSNLLHYALPLEVWIVLILCLFCGGDDSLYILFLAGD